MGLEVGEVTRLQTTPIIIQIKAKQEVIENRISKRVDSMLVDGLPEIK